MTYEHEKNLPPREPPIAFWTLDQINSRFQQVILPNIQSTYKPNGEPLEPGLLLDGDRIAVNAILDHFAHRRIEPSGNSNGHQPEPLSPEDIQLHCQLAQEMTQLFGVTLQAAQQAISRINITHARVMHETKTPR